MGFAFINNHNVIVIRITPLKCKLSTENWNQSHTTLSRIKIDYFFTALFDFSDSHARKRRLAIKKKNNKHTLRTVTNTKNLAAYMLMPK